MKNTSFPQQTHFIGVLPPEDLSLTLEDCRRYMRENYGCKSGHGTPIHVTLVPPFHLPEEYTTQDLVQAMEQEVLPFASKFRFQAHVEGFDAFGDRTIFARVQQNDAWRILRDKVLETVLTVAPRCTKKDTRPFCPHLTVANRDIPAGASLGALEVLKELQLTEDFTVDNITIFERQGSRWIEAWSGMLSL